MKRKNGFVQAYNAQAAVDAEAQIIVAQHVTQNGGDSGQLVPLIDAIETDLGRKPAQASSDAGYCSEANLAALEARDIDGYVAAGPARDRRCRRQGQGFRCAGYKPTSRAGCCSVGSGPRSAGSKAFTR